MCVSLLAHSTTPSYLWLVRVGVLYHNCTGPIHVTYHVVKLLQFYALVGYF